jgi:hypothetical protein
MDDLDWSTADWRRSQRSGTNGDCVECAFLGGFVGVRDSCDPTGTVLAFDHRSWRAFLAGVKDGEFDLVDLV